MSRRARIQGTLVALMLSIVLALAVVLLTRDTGDSRPDRERLFDVGTSEAGSPTRETADGSADEPVPQQRATGPNVVTLVDGVPVWALPEETIDAHLATLKALAEAGWSEAFVRLAPIAARCVTMPAQTDQQVLDLYDPDHGIIYRSEFYSKETERDRQVMRDQRTAFLESALAEARLRRQRCRDALGDDPDPDRYMDWLEHALEQQPDGFFQLLLDEPLVMPIDTGWLVRNAERLARFNAEFLSALHTRVHSGDPEVIGRAWKAFTTNRFLPQPDPLQAWAYGLVARRLSPPLSETAPTDDDFGALVEAGLDPATQERARQAAEALWRQCCVGRAL